MKPDSGEKGGGFQMCIQFYLLLPYSLVPACLSVCAADFTKPKKNTSFTGYLLAIYYDFSVRIINIYMLKKKNSARNKMQ